ncbi:MAG: 23S rRNA (adenine(2503)-C(2))-methyltransferase RlmN [Candidatus Gastranaerophilaceae bacterium]|jgi:23S rRNA (adenine2503-C2)-methyltransferase
MDNAVKISLSGLSLKKIEQFVESVEEPKFRAKQLHQWIYQKSASDFDAMTSLSKTFRQKLNNVAVITTSKIKQKLISSDGTIKYLLEYPDGNVVETVLMRFDNRTNLTACVSSQIGCPVGCVFCATGKKGFTRNLLAHEITNVVFMGQGEPLLNLDNVIKAIEIINESLVIGMRRITVSTSGIVPQIYKLAEEKFPLTLALSLHAPTHELRKTLIPIEEKYPVNEILKAVNHYNQTTSRRLTIEYTVIADVNDSKEDAKALAKLIKDLHCYVNFISYNPACSDKFKKPTVEKLNMFKHILELSGKKVTVRLERGADIAAACGQLSGQIV